MYKTITVYSLQEGTDPDEFFKYHTEVHINDAKKAAGGKMRKYVVNRILEVMGGKDPKVFGLVEMWWDNKEAMDEYSRVSPTIKTANGKTPSQDFEDRGGVFEYKLHVEEKEIQL